MPDPLDMRAAVAAYVEHVHRAYLAQADTFGPAVRGRMALLAGDQLTVVGAGARNLHLIGTRERLGPLRGQEVGHVGSGLASAHSRVARDFETIRSRARGREPLVDELEGAATAGLRRAQALLARAIAPRNATVAALAEAPDPDPDDVRKALLAHVGAGQRSGRMRGGGQGCGVRHGATR